MSDHFNADTLDREWNSLWSWLTERGEDASLPVHEGHVAAYLTELSQKDCGPEKILAALQSIRDRHVRAGFPSPTEAQSVREIQEALVPRSDILQPAPLTADDVEAIRDNAFLPRPRGRGHETPEQATTRALVDLSLVSVMRDALLHPGDVATVLWDDISRCEGGSGTLVVRCSKLDDCCRDHLTYLSPRSMQLLEAIRPDPCDPDRRVFEMTHGAVVRRIRSMTQAAGLGDGYGGHSPRTGMALDLAREGFSVAQIALAGRWHSPDMVPMHIRQDVKSQGAVSAFYARLVGDTEVADDRPDCNESPMNTQTVTRPGGAS